MPCEGGGEGEAHCEGTRAGGIKGGGNGQGGGGSGGVGDGGAPTLEPTASGVVRTVSVNSKNYPPQRYGSRV